MSPTVSDRAAGLRCRQTPGGGLSPSARGGVRISLPAASLSAASLFPALLFVTLLLTCCTTSLLRAEPWQAVQQWPAVEAHQAAAADERFFYAITNDRVAKYDRATGQRIAVSTGQAQHLNSGYFFAGKLYCAHSNYPRVPERSEIMVLDPATMQLTTFKEFGNYGGSLTWCVQRDGHWWCNFARYGADNAGTFLVQFTADWQEVARFTYPREVIRELGRNSLSGGLWREGLFQVTGHDDRVLFRLRLPQQGQVLEFVDQQEIPFTGQGIAEDPVTGGLIGIDRGKRLIIAAGHEP